MQFHVRKEPQNDLIITKKSVKDKISDDFKI